MVRSRILAGSVAAALGVSMGSLDGAGVNEELAKPPARRGVAASSTEAQGCGNRAAATGNAQRPAPLVLAELPTLQLNLKNSAAKLAAGSPSTSSTAGLSDHTYQALAVESHAPGALGSTVLAHAEYQRTLKSSEPSPATDLAALHQGAAAVPSRFLAHR